MHLNVRLPKVEPVHSDTPTRCPFHDPKSPRKKCNGTYFKEHQWNCRKPLRDTKHTQVTARRYRCLKCNRTFRVYPTGVSHLQQSDTLKGLSVLLYILGLSYQGVSDLLDTLGFFLSKTTVYNNVQAAGRQAIQLRLEWLKHQAGQVQAVSVDFTHVKRSGHQRIVAVATAVLTGQPITFDLLETEKTLHIEQWIRQIAKSLGAEVFVTDDADSLKNAADDLGMLHQICRAHVNRNVHDLIGELGTQVLEHPDRVPWELDPAQVTWDQFVEDLIGRDWHCIIAGVVNTAKNSTARIMCEQVIGQCVKERYRTMRGNKRDESILNVSSLIGWIRAQKPGYDMSPLITN
jgi:transposase-like protein